MSMTRRGEAALAVLGAIGAVTVAWWALALWPLSADAPEWLVRTRAACFGVRPNGLPHAGGWVMLIGEPIGMVSILIAVWGEALGDGVRSLRASSAGRVGLAAAALVVMAGLIATGVRVAEVRQGQAFAVNDAERSPDSYERLGRVPPPLRLVDQRGDTIDLARYRGRPVLLTFAYGHCQTVCPLVVHDLLTVQERVKDLAPAIIVVTLDPWRDTPSRLGHIAESWGLHGDAHLLGGSIDEVEATLDAWEVPRSRDANTGEVIHPATVHLIDRAGRLAFSVVAPPETIAALVGRL